LENFIQKSDLRFRQHAGDVCFHGAFAQFSKILRTKISLGSVNLPNSYSKYLPLLACAIRRTATPFAFPGGSITKGARGQRR
jgi:hypothetical protein